jgi:hypothetical protein
MLDYLQHVQEAHSQLVHTSHAQTSQLQQLAQTGADALPIKGDATATKRAKAMSDIFFIIKSPKKVDFSSLFQCQKHERASAEKSNPLRRRQLGLGSPKDKTLHEEKIMRRS